MFVFGVDTTLRDGDLRLQGGNKHSGRLEIYDRTRDEWGTICIERFTLQSADTACIDSWVILEQYSMVKLIS